MKHLKKIAAVSICILFAGLSSASAQSQEGTMRSYTLPTFTVEGFSDPELKSYVTPRVSTDYVGSDIMMYYTIGKTGKIHGIRSNAAFKGAELANAMGLALRNWKFEPATNSAGEPVPIRVAMPVEVVAPGSGSAAYASIQVAGMKLVAKSS